MNSTQLAKTFLLLLLSSYNESTTATAADRVAGDDADPSRFRWFGLIGGSKKVDTGCGGALIAPDFFLTTKTPSFCKGAKDSKFSVNVGVYCLDRKEEEFCLKQAQLDELPPVVDRKGDKEISRGDLEFDPSEIPGANRFYLVQLSDPVEDITPLVPDDGSGYALLGPSTKVTVVGSGSSSFFGGPPILLQSAKVSVVPSSVCQRDWDLLSRRSSSLSTDFVNASASALCTSNAICSGDDGASVVLEGGASNGADLLLSMALDGFNGGCKDKSSPPDLSLRASVVFDWLKEVVCSESVDPPFWCDDDASVVTCPRERNPNSFTFPSMQNCRWLKKQPAKLVRKLCESTAGFACPITCATCPTE